MVNQRDITSKFIKMSLGFRNFFVSLYSAFSEHNCQKSAAALTYMTLFALVPMMTVTYSMFSLIPAFDGVADQLQALIFDNFVPDAGREVQNYLSNFSSQARSLTFFGVGMLLVTALLMLTNIEKTFNAIWGVSEARKGLSSFLLYWAVLSLGPLLLGLGLIVSTYILSLKLFVNEIDQLGLSRPVFYALPLVMTSAAFTLLFAAVPNCKVPIRAALIGGTVTALCFELLKGLFSYLVSRSSFELIYGAFAFVPLFLLWINLVWVVVLCGALFVRTIAEKNILIREDRLSDMWAAMHCLSVFREKAKSGLSVRDYDCTRTGVGLVHWQHLRSLLLSDNWIVTTGSGDYVLSRDLKSVTLWQLANLVNLPLSEEGVEVSGHTNFATCGWQNRLKDLQNSVCEHAYSAYSINLYDFYENDSHFHQETAC